MATEKSKPSANRKEPRQYPPFWERAIPIVVGLIGLLVIVLVLIAASVALGIFPTGS